MCHCFRTLAEMRVETYHTTHKSNGNALLLKYRKASNNASSWCPSVLMLMYYTYSYMLHRASVPHAGIISSSPSAALGTSKCQLLARRKLHSTPSTQGVCWLGAGGDPWSWTCDVFTNNSCRSSAAAAAASGELPPAPDTRHWSLDTGLRAACLWTVQSCTPRSDDGARARVSECYSILTPEAGIRSMRMLKSANCG